MEGHRLSASRRDLLSGVTLVSLAVAYLLATSTLPAGVDEPGPRFFPRLLALALLALGVAIALAGMRTKPNSSDETPAGSFRPSALAVATLAFVALTAPLGLLPATFLYALAVGLSFRSRLLPAVITAAFTTAAVHGVFAYLLEVPLP